MGVGRLLVIESGLVVTRCLAAVDIGFESGCREDMSGFQTVEAVPEDESFLGLALGYVEGHAAFPSVDCEG